VELGEGILNNSLYIGQRIFNPRIWVEMPNDTRGFRRVPRLNPEADWVVRDEPDLCIIDQDLWKRVKQRQVKARTARDAKFKLTGNPLGGAKRPVHLLSGLVECGACGGPFVGTGGRWRCKAAMRQACRNASIRIDQLESRVLAGLREQLLTPEMIGKFARALQQELDEQQQVANAGAAGTEASLIDVRDRMRRLAKRIEEDEDAPRMLISRLKALEAEEADLAAAVTAAPARTVVRLPTNYELVYRRAVEQLEEHLRSDDGNAAREAIRVLIDKIVVQPGDERGGKRRAVQLHGDLFQMLDFASTVSGRDTRASARTRTHNSPGP